ncbi:hypothetical protein RhiJN_03601 [Ceratobasidium sp. AG-Ba]|nr:hypothetical protein RhiJN_03601 [Ceratobasidium sp. AG-Ba]QRW04496.1 hypothetical protein RhiLY_03495 [Ceratobasidium sp. AG-Ba]
MAEGALLVAHDMLVTRYVTIASIMLLLWDHVITLGDEITLIWPAKFGIVKAIFLFNRYGVSLWIAVADVRAIYIPKRYNVSLPSNEFPKSCLAWNLTASCRGWLIANVYMELVAVQTTAFIVATRVFDIWQSQRLAFFVLGPFWVIHCALDVFICTKNLILRNRTFTYNPLTRSCVGSVENTWTVWLNGIVYHALILCLLLWLWLSTPRTSQTPFMNVVIRDGFLYFITIFSAMLFNLLIWRYARSSLAGLPYTSVWAVTTISLSRMLLSMRSVQGPAEWGQRARIAVPSRSIDIELGARHRQRAGRVQHVRSSVRGESFGTVVSYSSFGSVVDK